MSIAWAAGLFEGEGCISLNGTAGSDRKRPVMILATTDFDVLRKFHDVIGKVGTIYPHARLKVGANRKPIWQWSLRGHDDVLRLFEQFRPHLGSRRIARGEEVLRISAETLRKYPDTRRHHHTGRVSFPEDAASVIADVLSACGKADLAALVRSDPATMKYALGFE
jgi:hypothetical protein